MVVSEQVASLRAERRGALTTQSRTLYPAHTHPTPHPPPHPTPRSPGPRLTYWDFLSRCSAPSSVPALQGRETCPWAWTPVHTCAHGEEADQAEAAPPQLTEDTRGIPTRGKGGGAHFNLWVLLPRGHCHLLQGPLRTCGARSWMGCVGGAWRARGVWVEHVVQGRGVGWRGVGRG